MTKASQLQGRVLKGTVNVILSDPQSTELNA